MGLFGVADFKQRPQIASVGGDAVMLENLSGVMIGDAGVLDFSGVEGESDAVAVQGCGQMGFRSDFFILP